MRFAALTIALVVLTPGLEAQTLSCRPSDAYAINLIDNVKQILTATDARTVALRQSMELNGVTPGQVSLVTSGTACTKLNGEMNRLSNTPTANRSSYVVKAGNKHFFLSDPNGDGAGYRNPTYVFDSKYKLIKALLA